MMLCMRLHVQLPIMIHLKKQKLLAHMLRIITSCVHTFLPKREGKPSTLGNLQVLLHRTSHAQTLLPIRGKGLVSNDGMGNNVLQTSVYWAGLLYQRTSGPAMPNLMVYSHSICT